ncbi:MAG: C-GCAxxG-C-C family protein [Candidatus Thorarchaeota archaeon SMTZ1-83]|nr:MAG: hypothetical protein AM324_01745 [Candidatus Thorarchaeota archaeon SMTZ1-83]
MTSPSTVSAALTYFLGEYNCAQSVVKSVLEHKGLYFDGATQLAAGFGGGICFSGQQCGAVSGAVIVIGLLTGKTVADTREHKAITCRLVEEFSARFTEEFGTIICDDLTGVEMSDEEAFTKALEKGHFREVCPKFVDTTVRMLLEMFPD